ncbi:hypothetical protein Tco_0140526 [Tanacetum coccineum]
MIELWAHEELKDTIVVAVEYEWKPPRCSCCKVFGHTHDECPKNIGVGVAKNLKKPSQTSRDEVASVDNDMTRSMASERVGFGTQSLLEQWRDSYRTGDYDDDPYDDDMYKGQDLPKELQTICDNLDIRVRGRRRNKFLFLVSSHFMYIPFRK